MSHHRKAETLEDLPSPEQVLSMSGLEFMQAMIDGKFAGPPIGHTMGFHPVHVADGKAVFEGTPDISVTNPMRTVHGGWYGAILDSCMACAVMTKVPQGSVYTTLEFKINIIRSIPLGTPVQAVGTINHAGRSTGIATGEIRGISDNRLYATGSTTCIIMKGTPPPKP